MIDTVSSFDPDLWDVGGPVAKAHAEFNRCYSPRPEQMRMAGIIEEALRRQRQQPVGLLPIEAATGTGKTLAYLIPGALHAARTRGRMLVSTHTIELGRQITEEDGLIAQRVAKHQTGVDLRIAHMRGRRHFVSSSRARSVGNLMRDDGLPESSWRPYIEIAMAVDELVLQATQIIKSGLFPSNSQQIVRGALIDIWEDGYGVSLARDEICLLSTSPELEQSVHRLSRALADSSQILITTHAYTVVSLAVAALFNAAEDPFTLLVIDEADQWASAASSVSLVGISMQTLRQAVENVVASSRHQRKSEDFGSIAKPLLEDITELSDLAPKARDTIQPIGVDDPALQMLRVICNKIDDLLSASRSYRSHMATSADNLKEQADEIRRILKLSQSNETDFWLPRWTTSRVEALPSISVTGRAPGRIMKRLWGSVGDSAPLARTIVLTSATLATPGFASASRWKSIDVATGFGGSPALMFDDLATAIEPAAFGTMDVRFADPRAPIPRVGDGDLMEEDSLAYSVAVIEQARQMSGRTLVLLPSYANTLQFVKLIPEAVIHRKGTPLRELLSVYRATPQCCLITPAAWVGVNLPGLIQHLVIPRIPYPPRSTSNFSNSAAKLLSETLTKLSQGLGRGIRTDSDYVTVWFADPRMPLPDCLIEETGLLRCSHSNIALLASIPVRFRKRFGVIPGAAAIGVPFTSPAKPPSLKQSKRSDDVQQGRSKQSASPV